MFVKVHQTFHLKSSPKTIKEKELALVYLFEIKTIA
jgi:hypothetical protein